jgi:hypothetical protein
MYISQDKGGPVIPPGTGFLFTYLLISLCTNIHVIASLALSIRLLNYIPAISIPSCNNLLNYLQPILARQALFLLLALTARGD